ncbi:hypothetical protein [Ilyobacter polytropus]|uniref:4Fe-4S ferredoxin-type domain-containing protein n=1 Tax=Ilyobacter polytropus (strain ATCC 51220 / DSM 2926 / LMG 16218 / CuHBu1) TaxID=572544 RepID=E3H9J1_ILYPC|nr:hypothetical protein [Ilyobacter polytropus]ADO83380.1 hypothetical protein Ilyop_1602 [Ilyobacter polytropus DSM 2926]
MKSNFRKTRCEMQSSSIAVNNNKNCENCSFCERKCPTAIKIFKAQSQCITCCANKSKISYTLSLKSKDIKNNVIYTVVAIGIYLIFRY